jgi:putative phosphonoacetaldehyde dehydrogenase
VLDIGDPPFVFPAFVDGRPLDADARIEVRYPFTGAIVGSVPSLGADEVARALRLSAASSHRLTRHERSRILLRTADRIEGERERVARLITWESGLCLKDTRHEVARALDVLRFAASEALRDDGQCFSFDVSPNGRSRRGYTMREPLRLVTAITPFNHPLNQVAHKVAPAVAAGTPIVLKPSEKTPLTAAYFVAALHEAGLPPNAVNLVTGDPEVLGPILVQHPDVALVTFTGGVEIGKRIARSLGYRRAVLELGGNDPLIVLDDADLDEAVRLATTGAFANSGQRCTAVKRILVTPGVADAFAARLAEAAEALVVGDPMDERTDVGTVISEASARELERRASATIASGATLLAGNRRRGALCWPTVLDHVRPDAESVRTETFGPHAPILRVTGPDDALRVANATPYGLSAGVCTNDLALAMRFVRELECGTVNIREVPGYRTEGTPFGGIKDSGLGVKEGVIEAMKAMSFVKMYTMPW